MRNYKSESIASIQSTFFVFGFTWNTINESPNSCVSPLCKNIEKLEYWKTKKKKREEGNDKNSNYLFIIKL